MKRILTILLCLGVSMQSYAVSFTPYTPSDEEEITPNAGGMLQNWRYEDGTENEYLPDKDHPERNYLCSYCLEKLGAESLTEDIEAEYEACEQAIYSQGVLPSKNENYYEFPGCLDPECPLHHIGGWAADEYGGISDTSNVAIGWNDRGKPQLPVGEPLVMLLFAGIYAAVRRRKDGKK